MFHAGTGDSGAGGSQVQFFIVKGGSAVFYIQFGDDKINAVFFQFAVGQAVDAEQLGASHFEPDGIDGVMNHAGLIGFAVAGNNGNGVVLDFGTIRELLLLRCLLVRGLMVHSHGSDSQGLFFFLDFLLLMIFSAGECGCKGLF